MLGLLHLDQNGHSRKSFHVRPVFLLVDLQALLL